MLSSCARLKIILIILMKYYWLLINDFNLIGLKLIRKKKYLYDEFECGLKILLLTITKKKKKKYVNDENFNRITL